MEKSVLCETKEGKPTIFLGGETKTDWRDEVIDEFADTMTLIDPVDPNWKAEENIYDELADMLTSDAVVFYKGGEGTEHEKEFLKKVGEDYEEVNDMEELEDTLTQIEEMGTTKLEEGEVVKKDGIPVKLKEDTEVSSNEGNLDIIKAAIEIPLEVGDEILTGKFKNKRVKVKSIGKDDKGQPTVNGRPLLNLRVPKLMKDAEWKREPRPTPGTPEGKAIEEAESELAEISTQPVEQEDVSGKKLLLTEELPPALQDEAKKAIPDDWDRNVEGTIMWYFSEAPVADLMDTLEKSWQYTEDEIVNDPYFRSLMADIKENGIRVPIIIGPYGLEGNRRLLAAHLLGIKTVPVVQYIIKEDLETESSLDIVKAALEMVKKAIPEKVVGQGTNNNAELDFTDYNSAYKWALENVDDLDEDYRDPMTGQSLDELVAEYTAKYQEVMNVPEVEIYRMVSLENIENLNTDHVGVWWSFLKEGVGTYGAPPGQKGENYILTATIDPKNIDWESGYYSFLNYAEQMECNVNKNAPLKLISIEKPDGTVVEVNRQVTASIIKTAEDYGAGCIMVPVPDNLRRVILKEIAPNIPEDSLKADEDNMLNGVETQTHATLLYGPQPTPENIESVQEYFTEPVTVKSSGKIEYFDNDDASVAIIPVESEELAKLHDTLKENIPNKDEYNEYKPHITIAYLNPGKRLDVEEVKPFEWEIQKLMWSDKNGETQDVWASGHEPEYKGIEIISSVLKEVATDIENDNITKAKAPYERGEFGFSDVPTKAEGEAGYGIYAYPSDNAAMRAYYTQGGEDVISIWPEPGATIIDLTTKEALDAIVNIANEQMPGGTKANRSNAHKQYWAIKQYLYDKSFDAYLVRHAGPGIPTGKQLVITNEYAFIYRKKSENTIKKAFDEGGYAYTTPPGIFDDIRDKFFGNLGDNYDIGDFQYTARDYYNKERMEKRIDDMLNLYDHDISINKPIEEKSEEADDAGQVPIDADLPGKDYEDHISKTIEAIKDGFANR